MKRLYSFGCFLLFTIAAHGQSVLLTENFDYVSGDSIRANGWTRHSGATNSILVIDSGLRWTQSPYKANNIGRAAGVNNTGSDENRNFSSYINAGDVYISFLCKVRVPIANLFFMHTGAYGNTTTPVFTTVNSAFRGRTFAVPGATPDKFRFGLAFNASAVTTDVSADLDTSKVYLVVLKYRFVAGDLNDQVSLYVFEDGSNIAIEPAVPTIGPLTGTAADATFLQYVALRQDNASQRIIVDGIVAQTSWDMLPTNTWNGTAWSAGQAPNGENAVIDGNLNLSAGLTAGNVTINSGHTLNLNGNSLTIQGNLTNNGVLQMGSNNLTITGTYSGTGNISANGGHLTLTGSGNLGALSFDQTTDGVTNSLANLTLNRNNTGGASLTNKLNITNSLVLTAGTLTTNGHLHLKSTSATATAQVIGGTNSNIVGNVTAERFLPWAAATNNGFRFVSHPLQTTPVFNTVINLPVANNTLIAYNEVSNAYVGLNDRTGSWPLGIGYGAWANGVNTLSFTGELQLSTLSNVTMSNTNQRYNLAGNPFPSVLDWEAVTTTDMEDAVWTWVKDNSGEGSGAWASYVNGVSANGGTQFIAPMQGFMVRANNSGSPAITFPAAARVSGQTPTFNRTANLGDVFRIRVEKTSNGSGLETVLRFHDLGSVQYDASLDAGFISDFENASPDFYTADLQGNKYSINSLPAIGINAVTIPLNIETFGTGAFSLHFDASGMQSGTNVQLEDTKLGIFTPLNNGQTINFNAGTNDAITRFRLHFNGISTSVVANELDPVQLYTHEGRLYTKGIEQAESLRILDISGRLVYELNKPQFDGNALQPNLNKGTYLVQLISNQGVKTVKVVF